LYEGLDAPALAARLSSPRVVLLERVTSTLDVVHALAADGAPSGTLVLAEEQTSGRGRQGRRWYSPAGQGIWLGYLMRPRSETETGVIALRVGLAAVAALGDLDVRVQIKWPNDLVAQDRKLGGILCEGRWRDRQLSWLAVGIGLNVLGPLPDEVAGSAVALDALKSGLARVDVLDTLVPRLGMLPHDPVLSPAELQAFGESDWLYGRDVASPVKGRALGVSEAGALLVETAEGLERVVGGTVVTA
jgi:BirA family biotin operon repressor/biotin-[acetyl-CoA-carboxylase] ligase